MGKQVVSVKQYFAPNDMFLTVEYNGAIQVRKLEIDATGCFIFPKNSLMIP